MYVHHVYLWIYLHVCVYLCERMYTVCVFRGGRGAPVYEAYSGEGPGDEGPEELPGETAA